MSCGFLTPPPTSTNVELSLLWTVTGVTCICRLSWPILDDIEDLEEKKEIKRPKDLNPWNITTVSNATIETIKKMRGGLENIINEKKTK